MSPYPEDHPVRMVRQEKGWTLEELGSRCKCSNPLLSNIERGYLPQESTRRRIAAALGVSTDYLWPPSSGA